MEYARQAFLGQIGLLPNGHRLLQLRDNWVSGFDLQPFAEVNKSAVVGGQRRNTQIQTHLNLYSVVGINLVFNTESQSSYYGISICVNDRQR